MRPSPDALRPAYWLVLPTHGRARPSTGAVVKRLSREVAALGRAT